MVGPVGLYNSSNTTVGKEVKSLNTSSIWKYIEKSWNVFWWWRRFKAVVHWKCHWARINVSISRLHQKNFRLSFWMYTPGAIVNYSFSPPATAYRVELSILMADLNCAMNPVLYVVFNKALCTKLRLSTTVVVPVSTQQLRQSSTYQAQSRFWSRTTSDA